MYPLLLTLLLAADPAANYKSAAAYSQSHTGQALLVYTGKDLVFEEYFNGYSAETPHVLASGTKSFAGVVAACAVEDGLLTWDELCSDTLTEWKSDPRKSKISVRHLLSLTCGLDHGRIGMPPKYADALASEARYDPGNKFEYGPVPYQCFGELMKRKLKPKNEDYLKYLHRRVLDPIGLKVARWQKDADGDPHLPSGAFLTAKEWAKFGLFLKADGMRDGKQLVKKELLAELVKPGRVQPKYGLTLWLAPAEGEAKIGAEDFFMAAGAGNQRLYVMRSSDLVVVQFADFRGEKTGKFEDKELI